MKMLFDFFPVIAFFIAYKQFDIIVATGVLIGASAVQIGWTWTRHRKFETMHVITFGVVLVFGGATILLRDPVFIKWKPTIVYWLLAVAFGVSHFLRRPSFTQALLKSVFRMPDANWNRLNAVWVTFFLAAGALNLYVAFTWSEDAWVNFKLFGLMGLTFAFMMAQAVVLRAYLIDEASTTPSP